MPCDLKATPQEETESILNMDSIWEGCLQGGSLYCHSSSFNRVSRNLIPFLGLFIRITWEALKILHAQTLSLEVHIQLVWGETWALIVRVCVCVWFECAAKINLYAKESVLLTLVTVVPV